MGIPRFRLLVLLAAAFSVWLAMGESAHADVCVTKTVKSTTGSVCITTVKPEGGTPVSPSGGTVTVSGHTTVTATVTYTPRSLPAGEVRGCGGERLTPSGCLTWYVNGAYTLTQLYPTSGSGTYVWSWSTSQYPNGGRTLSAQIKINGQSTQVNVPVSVANANPSSLRSPVPNGGKIPPFPAQARSTGFTVVAVGDGPAGSLMTKAVADMVHRWDPDMLMYLGDVYQRGMKDEFLNFYQPIYGADWYRTLPTIGNHEYKQLPDGHDYFWYWNYPQQSPIVARGGGGWYSIDAGGWHLISLNSNVEMTRDPPSPQGTWLAADLAADRASRPWSTTPCTMAFFHHPRFSDISLRKPSTSYLWNQLYPYGADVIMTAHSHVYERWRPLTNSGAPTDVMHGITEFVVGTGGNVLAQRWQTNDSRSAFRQNTRWGALKMTLYAHSMHYEYWTAKTGSGNSQTMIDAGDIPCHGSPVADKTPPTMTAAASVEVAAPSAELSHLTKRAAPVRLSWTATDNRNAADLSFRVQRSCAGGTWRSLADTAEMTAVRWTRRGRSCRFRVQAVDGAGNASDWAESRAVTARVVQEDRTGITHPDWRLASSPDFDGGHVRYSKVAGQALRYSFTGRNVAWIGVRGPLRGEAAVFIDGNKVATVSLHASSPQFRQVLFTRNWAVVGNHRITIRVSGTAGHPRVDVDGFLHM